MNDNIKLISSLELPTSESSAQAHSVGSQHSLQRLGVCLQQILRQYSDVFKGLDMPLIGPELHLEVDESTNPVQQPPRKVPEALKEPLKGHLAKLIDMGSSRESSSQQNGLVLLWLPGN